MATSDYWDKNEAPGHLKGALVGGEGSGKTWTAVLMLLAFRIMRGLKGPLAAFDTETGIAYAEPMIVKLTGQKPLVKRARSVDELVRFIVMAREAGAAGVIVDSLTHVWRTLCDGYLAAVNERRRQSGWQPIYRLEFQHWNAIKPRWQRFVDLYLNEPMSIVACGRAGWEYEMAEAEEKDGNGKPKKELQKVGVKMKAEGEFGYEAALYLQMEREQILGGEHVVLQRRAVILKDRFSVMDGETRVFPSVKPAEFELALREVADFFKPHLALLVNGGHVSVDTSAGQVDEDAIPNGGLRGDVRPLHDIHLPKSVGRRDCAPVSELPRGPAEVHVNNTALESWRDFLRSAPFEEFTDDARRALIQDFGGSPPKELQDGWYKALRQRYVEVAAEASTPEAVTMLRQKAEKDWMGKPLHETMTRAFAEAEARVAPKAAAPAPAQNFGPPDEDDEEPPVDDGQGPIAETLDACLSRLRQATTLAAVDMLESAGRAARPLTEHGIIRKVAHETRQRLAPSAASIPPPPPGPPPAPVTSITSRRAVTGPSKR